MGDGENSQPVISASDLVKFYGNYQAVKGITFEIFEDECFAIIGHNGAGKSTTIKMLIGLLEQTEGDLTVQGTTYHKNQFRLKSMIGYMPEESSLYDHMTIQDYLLFFSRLYHIKRKDAIEQIEALGTLLDLSDVTMRIGACSKGMKRKVLLIRALLHDPKILVLDEPTSGLDPVSSSKLLDHIKSLKKGRTIIFTGHNLFQIEDLCDRVMILDRGEIAFLDTMDKLKEHASASYTVTIKTKSKETQKSFDSTEKYLDFINKKKKTEKIVKVQTTGGSLQQLFIDRFGHNDEK